MYLNENSLIGFLCHCIYWRSFLLRILSCEDRVPLVVRVPQFRNPVLGQHSWNV
jgi:hypothetical protein